MICVLKLLAVTALLPLPSDTPPARRVSPPAPRELRAVEDVVLSARMPNGAAAPSTIVLPQLRNRAEVIAYIRANYPDSANSLPTVVPVAWVYIDEAGKTHMPELIVSSGMPKVDTLAIAAVRRASFAPALIEKKSVAVWVMLPVQVAGPIARTPDAPCYEGSRPCFTPYTKKPELKNRDEVARALVHSYPPELRARGVGGTTLVWIYVDKEGNVLRAQVKESSGEPLLDAGAIRVATSMRWSPALNRDVNVGVWIQVPIIFRAH